jgi:hypothetical protein
VENTGTGAKLAVVVAIIVDTVFYLHDPPF